MDDELEALLRDHYRRGADEIHAEPALVRRFQAAGAEEARTGAMSLKALLRRWTLPVLAGAVTAAVVVAVAVLLWPGADRSDTPRPLGPPAPATSSPSPSGSESASPEAPTAKPSRPRDPSTRPPESGPPRSPDPAPSAEPPAHPPTRAPSIPEAPRPRLPNGR